MNAYWVIYIDVGDGTRWDDGTPFVGETAEDAERRMIVMAAPETSEDMTIAELRDAYRRYLASLRQPGQTGPATAYIVRPAIGWRVNDEGVPEKTTLYRAALTIRLNQNLNKAGAYRGLISIEEVSEPQPSSGIVVDDRTDLVEHGDTIEAALLALLQRTTAACKVVRSPYDGDYEYWILAFGDRPPPRSDFLRPDKTWTP